MTGPSSPLRRRPRVAIEALERRQLFAGDFNAGYALPMLLEFNKNSIGLLDRDGVGTGFTWVQPNKTNTCLLYTSPSPRDGLLSRMPSSA